MKIEMHDIYKAFGNNNVLEGVNFDVLPGEVHALMGENGAGKSTLMNILTGLVAKDAGTILIDEVDTQFENAKLAEEHGISFIHQELVTWPDMTVLENLFMGKEMTRGFGLVDNPAMAEQALEVFNELGIETHLNNYMHTLSVGQQQLIEIAKALLNDASVIIMDEPTAALTNREIDVLFEIIHRLTRQGVSIIYISHRMNEIFTISDRVTVMRDGISVITKKTSETTEREIVRAMVGRDIEDYYPDTSTEMGEVILRVENLTKSGQFENISFELHEGEILGVSGLMGAGRTEIMRAIFGVDTFDSGEVYVKGNSVRFKTPEEAIKNGLGFLTENRKEEGLILDFSLRDNISITSIDEFASYSIINTKEEEEFVDLLIQRLAVRTTGMYQLASSLSGGNQQKVVLAKWIGAGSQILILDEPTRGVDVGAKREIYILMKELSERGIGIIMVSSDLPEVIGVSDRVIVIHEGHLTGELNRNELTEERIMTYATGGK